MKANHAVIILLFFLAACGPRFEAAQKCQDDAAAMTGGRQPPGSILGILEGTTPQQYQAYNDTVNACIARYNQASNGD